MSIDAIHDARARLKAMAEQVGQLKSGLTEGEAIANVVLAYRHLEDASMRLGKAIQALDGGISVYDPATTTRSLP